MARWTTGWRARRSGGRTASRRLATAAAAVLGQRHARGECEPAAATNSEAYVLPHLDFPKQHRAKVHSTNPLERLNKVKRCADVVGIFPNEASIIRLIGAVLLEQNDEWQLQHRYMQVEAMAELMAPATRPRPSNSHPQHDAICSQPKRRDLA
jgi:transposase-like protein